MLSQAFNEFYSLIVSFGDFWCTGSSLFHLLSAFLVRSLLHYSRRLFPRRYSCPSRLRWSECFVQMRTKLEKAKVIFKRDSGAKIFPRNTVCVCVWGGCMCVCVSRADIKAFRVDGLHLCSAGTRRHASPTPSLLTVPGRGASSCLTLLPTAHPSAPAPLLRLHEAQRPWVQGVSCCLHRVPF